MLAFLSLLQAQQPRKLDNVCTPADEDALGLACSEDDPCAVFLELSSVEANGSSLFVTGNLHTVNTTMFGLLLETEDGGQTWTEPNKRLRSSALEGIQFLDFQHGWISGTKLEPLPRDPFLLSTSDGGKSWRQNPLFDDTMFGSIQQFSFDSPTNGELVLDRSQGATTRYERYVSMTGGSSWELQQTDSKPIRLAKVKPKESGSWRLRADADAYRVERRTAADGWEAVASFAIHAGDCK
jgi:photosystem II stability/assembly factor-like uncharacterized protein